MRRKYKNQPITVDGVTFDSKKEYKRYCELRLLERAGKISNIQKQVKFVLIPAQREVIRLKNGKEKPGKVIEREVAYYADFTYTDNATGKLVVEDVKSNITRTNPTYTIKRKLLLYVHGIRLKEVE